MRSAVWRSENTWKPPESVRIGAVPAHEPVQAAERGDPLRAGAEVQVVGVAEHDLRAEVAQLGRQHRLHASPSCPTGMNTGVSTGPCAVCEHARRGRRRRWRRRRKCRAHCEQHRVAEAVEAVALRRPRCGRGARTCSTPANAITSASSVERGRWKLVTSAPVAAKAYPGVMKSRVRPASGPRAGRAPDRLEHPHRGGADGDDAAALAAGRGRSPAAVVGRHRVAPRCAAGGRRGRRRSRAGTCRARRPASPRPPRCRRRSRSTASAVKCRPAVGAAAEPGMARRTRSGSRPGSRAAGGCTAAAASRRSRSSASAMGPGPAPASVTVHVGPPAARSATSIVSVARRVSVSPSRSRRAGRASASQRAVRARLEQQHLDRPAGGAPGLDPRRQHAGVVQRRPGRRRAARRAGRRSAGAGSRPWRGRTPGAARCRAARPASARSGRRRKVVVEVSGAHRLAYRPARSRDDVDVGRDRCGTAPARRTTRSSAGPVEIPAPLALDRRMWTWPPRHEPFHMEVDAWPSPCRRRSRPPSPRP